MTDHKLTISICLVTVLLLGFLGIGLVAAYGSTPPPWLLAIELAAVAGTALIWGFTGVVAKLLPWLRLRSIRGTLCVALGVVSFVMPPQLLVAMLFLSLGIKLVWADAVAVEEQEKSERLAMQAEAVPIGANGTRTVLVDLRSEKPATTARIGGMDIRL